MLLGHFDYSLPLHSDSYITDKILSNSYNDDDDNCYGDDNCNGDASNNNDNDYDNDNVS